jgi:tricorn protease
MRWEGVPSPDGKWIAHNDRKQRLWLLEVASGNNRLLQQGEGFGRYNFGGMKWSPDSSALVAEVSLLGNQGRRGLVVLRVADGQPLTIASQRYDSFSPSFSPDGRWLWFLSDRHFEAIGGTPWGERNMGPFFDKRTRAYAVALQPGNRFPFQPRDELLPAKPEPSPPTASDAQADAAPPAKPAAAKIPPIAWDGLEQRLFTPKPLLATELSRFQVRLNDW